MCPLEEVAHGPAGGSAVSQPPVQIHLSKIAQVLTALIQPGQQVEGNEDARPREVGRSPGEGSAGGSSAGAAEHEPVREGPDQPGMVSWLAVQQVLQPGRQALQVLVARGQDTGVDQHLPDIVQRLGLRQVIEQVVGDGVACPGRATEQLGRSALASCQVGAPRPADVSPISRPEYRLGAASITSSCRSRGTAPAPAHCRPQTAQRP